MTLGASAALAIDLNTDAMKKMQEEGHKIVEQETQAERAFELPNGQCLVAGGGNVVSAKCNDKAANQKWKFDDKGRLVASNGKCVAAAGGDNNPEANAVLQKCNNSPAQQWKLDNAKRLVNENDICLQAKGKNVVTAKCSKAATQKWG